MVAVDAESCFDNVLPIRDSFTDGSNLGRNLVVDADDDDDDNDKFVSSSFLCFSHI